MGFKPLFYTIQKDRLFIDSDLDTLITRADITLEPDYDAIYSFLHYATIALDKTMYRGIHRLPPGHEMVVENNKILSIERYWFPEKIEIDHKIIFEEAKDRFLELFDAAVSKFNLDDPTLVFQLSGGLDSSSIVCYLAKKYPNKTIRTVTMDFDHPSADEKHYVKMVEDLYPNIRPIHFNMETLDHAKEYPVSKLYEQHPHWPFFTSLTSFRVLLQALRESGFRTIVTGEGGDELLQGTPLVMADYLKQFRWRKLWREISHCEEKKKCFKSYALAPLLGKKNIRKIRQLLGKQSPPPRYPKNFTDLEESFKCPSKAFCREVGFLTSTWVNYLIESSFSSWARQKLRIEHEHPFYDQQLMEFIISLPGGYKYREGVSKYILREALRGILPDGIVARDDKAGFFHEFRKRIDSYDKRKLIEESALVQQGLITKEDALSLLSHYETSREHSPFYFSRLVHLELWYKRFL